MARGRIFKITKAQAEGYEVLDPPTPRRRRARSNPGVTAIMGITNGRGAAKRAARKLRRRGRITGIKPVRKQTRIGGIDCLSHAPPKHARHGSTSRSDFAFPQCFRFPVRKRGKATKAKIKRAISYYGKSRHLYSPTVRREIEHGIARAAFEAGVTSPVAMRYRKKFALANAKRGESPMFVVPNRKRKPRKATRKAARKTTRKLKFGSPAWQKKYNPLYGGKRKSGKARKSSKRVRRLSPARAFMLYPRGKKVGATASPNKRRKARKAKRGTARKVSFVRVTRAKGKKLSVFMRNRKRAAAASPNKRRRSATKYTRAWHHKMTKAVANAYRRARRNAEGEEPDWSEPRETASEWTGTQADARKEARAAAAAAAEGMALEMFKSQADFDAWFANAWKSKTFRKYYNAHRRGIAVKSRKKTTMARKKARKGAARKPRKARKARKGARKLKFGSPAWRKKYARKIAAGRRKAKKARKSGTRKATRRTTRKAARRPRKATRRTRRKATRRSSAARKPRFGTKAFARKYAKKAAATRRRRHGRKARRNFGFIPNQLVSRVKALAVPGLVALGGYAVHRFVTTLVSKTIGGSLGTYADPISGLAALAVGVWATGKFLPAHALPAALGMAVSFGALLVKSFLPSVATYLGLGSIASSNQRVRYGMMGPQFMQAAAGPQFMQAAAGPQFMQAAADYFQPTSGIGEYVSDGSLAPVSDFGEYVASNLDISGWGDYEISTQYQTGADGYGAVNDGIAPGGNLDQQFNIMEAAAGLGLSSPGTSSIYVPHEGAKNVGSAESSQSSGVFDVGGGNGVLG